MKQVTFYGNHEDNLHCMLAVYRSIFDYFYNERLDWAQLEELTGFNTDKAAWSLKVITYLARRGLDINMLEPFDYARYYDLGESYLNEFYSPVEKNWQLEHSNILEIKPLIPEFLENVQYTLKQPTLNDIDAMLDDDRLVFVTLNSRVLNDETGYFAHAVLIIDRDEGEYIVHDPGLPPLANRHIDRQKFLKAMGDTNTTSEVTGFRLPATK